MLKRGGNRISLITLSGLETKPGGPKYHHSPLKLPTSKVERVRTCVCLREWETRGRQEFFSQVVEMEETGRESRTWRRPALRKPFKRLNYNITCGKSEETLGMWKCADISGTRPACVIDVPSIPRCVHMLHSSPVWDPSEHTVHHWAYICTHLLLTQFTLSRRGTGLQSKMLFTKLQN